MLAQSAFLIATLAVSAAENTPPAVQQPDGQYNLLGFALDSCTDANKNLWEPAARNEYIESLVDYHQAYWSRVSARGGYAVFELFNEDGGPVDLSLPSGEKFYAYKFLTVVRGQGAVTRGCSIHFGPSDGPSLAEMTDWSRKKPEQRLVPVLYNEATWDLQPPEDSGWDFTTVSEFDPETRMQPNAKNHPFRGVVISFSRTEF